MNKSLEDKLATMLNHLAECRAGRVEERHTVMNSMLDDPEIAEWLQTMSNQSRVNFTRFN